MVIILVIITVTLLRPRYQRPLHRNEFVRIAITTNQYIGRCPNAMILRKNHDWHKWTEKISFVACVFRERYEQWMNLWRNNGWNNPNDKATNWWQWCFCSLNLKNISMTGMSWDCPLSLRSVCASDGRCSNTCVLYCIKNTHSHQTKAVQRDCQPCWQSVGLPWSSPSLTADTACLRQTPTWTNINEARHYDALPKLVLMPLWICSLRTGFSSMDMNWHLWNHKNLKS